MANRLTASALIGALVCGALALGEAVGPAPAHAASFDPSLTWRTLETPHFRITFHGGEEAQAEEFAAVAEEVWATMTAEIQWNPRRRTEVVLVDQTDSANGYASALPVNTIVIFVTAPADDSTLSNYDVWSSSIFTHEYTHILHLDTTEGIPALVRALFGRIVAVNQVSPRWVVEGYATFQETRHTTAGRGRSTIVDMIKRMTVLEDDFPPLGNLDGFQVDPPGGNLRYLYGQDFMQFISDRSGVNVWTDWTHVYGGRPIPFWLPSRKTLGASLPRLYQEWKADMTDRYTRQRAEIEARGLTPFTVLSEEGDSCAGPTYSPDGSALVWSCSNAYTGSAIFRAGPDGEDPRVELENYFATSFAWRPDGQAFGFSALHTVARFNLYEDVYFHKLGSDSVMSLTSGARVRDPAFSSDGRDLWVVRNKLQRTQLGRLSIDQSLDVLTHFEDHTQLATPRPSPDGRHLVLSVFQDGRRDLWLFTAEGKVARRITADAASDIQPAWSADGRTLYFVSDRTGVYNIYAIDLETEHLYQVSNVLGGAFAPNPSPDGAHIVFESYSADGTDIARMEIDRSAWRDEGPLQLPLVDRTPLKDALPSAPITPPQPAEPDSAADEDEDKGWLERRKERRAEKKQERAHPKKGRGRRGRAPLVEETGVYSPYAMDGLDGLGGAFHGRATGGANWGEPAANPYVHVEDDSAADDPEDKVKLDQDKEQDYPFSWPVKRYTPSGLFPPRYLVPSLYQTAYGYMGVLSTSGTDVLRRYIYSGYVSYRTDSHFVGWGAAFALNQFIPVFSVGAYTDTTPYGDVFVLNEPPSDGGLYIPSVYSANQTYWDKRLHTYLQGSYSIDSRRTVFGRYTGTLRQSLYELPDDTYLPFLPDRGFISSIGGGWRYAYGRSYGRSISLENARIVSVVGEWTSSYLGSYVLNDEGAPEGFDQLQLTGEWTEYRSLPWAHNHVLAARLALGGTLGDSQAYGSFRLGGDFGESAYYTLPDEWKPLRGFPPATVYGDWYYLGTMEYRAPIWWIDRGLGVIPAYARYVSAAAFVDAGNAVENTEALTTSNMLGTSRVGTGVELRAQALLGWGWGVTGRLGYAFAVAGDGGYAPGSLEGLYAWFGTTF